MLCGSVIWKRKTPCLGIKPRKWSTNHHKNANEENQSEPPQSIAQKVSSETYILTAFFCLLISPLFSQSHNFKKKQKKLLFFFSQHQFLCGKKEKLNRGGELSTHWESAARLRLPCDPDPPSMSAAGRDGGSPELPRPLAVRVWAGPPEVPCYQRLKCCVQDAPVFSLCVNTLVCPCDESLGLSSAKSTPPHPFPRIGSSES